MSTQTTAIDIVRAMLDHEQTLGASATLAGIREALRDTTLLDAAPDLLAACRMLHKCADCGNHHDLNGAGWVAIRASIAKAEGRS